MQGLVIFGDSNILSDLFDCAMANGLPTAHVVPHFAEAITPRSLTLAQRLAALAPHGVFPTVVTLDAFVPEASQLYLLSPTTPTRAALAREVGQRFGAKFTTLVHQTA